MKAALLESVKNIQVKDVSIPELRKNTALLRVRACGICGSDMKFYNYGDRVKKFPQILGHEAAGEVAEVGDGVENFSVGDRIALANEIPCKSCHACRRGVESVCDNILGVVGVSIPGGFAEYMILNEDMIRQGPVNKMPENVTFEEGAIAEPLGCVVNGLEFADMEEGKDVLVIGTGPIGCMIINLCRLMGASKITAVEKNPRRLDMARAFDADHYVYAENSKFLDEALELTGGRGYDIVMSACNDNMAHENAIKAVAKGGFVNLFGGIAKGLPDDVKFQSIFLHYRQFAIGGSFSQTKEHHRKALGYLSSGGIKTKKLITHRFGLDKIITAIETVQRAEGLKVMINP
ncbi:MAG: alcohol dehydrogenase catalytic domain-containing protein [Candidatus Aenigmarchaeota archaeon]|nr:alcohol dehydrogenase catalytic domain-containing protein [Candidatus Aenigmarchaeota archaeon]MDI6722682.1 alcohol dehydrogenase catalytic domain-containing protein [Candidatus Aenigmarchaeota archaeon]